MRSTFRYERSVAQARGYMLASEREMERAIKRGHVLRLVASAMALIAIVLTALGAPLVSIGASIAGIAMIVAAMASRRQEHLARVSFWHWRDIYEAATRRMEQESKP